MNIDSAATLSMNIMPVEHTAILASPLLASLQGIPLRGPHWKVKAKVEVERREAVCSD